MGPELVLTLMSSWWLILFNRLADWLRIMAVVWASIFSAMQVGPVSHGGILVTTNQFLRPSGPRVEFSGSPADLAVTAGITPGYPAPASMVADNDLAPGQIVQAISASAFWPASAIRVTEDDAQNGVDHVDGHRTLCLVASPYARRGVVDSTSYNQTSIVRTIDDLLGMPPMNKFDAAALPMRSVFATVPDTTTYIASPNLTPLARVNPPAGSLKGRERKAAFASLKMDFVHPDAAPENQLNRILWHAAEGWSKRFPKIPHRPACKVDDDDR
jgi:hypothetical protein